MLIWKGLGILALIIPIAIGLLLKWMLGEDPLIMGWGILTGAIPVWLIGRSLHAKPARIKLDPKTNQKILEQPTHHFFWVKLEYWAIITGLFGLAMITENITGGASKKALPYLAGIAFLGFLAHGLFSKYIKTSPSTIPNPTIPATSKETATTFAKKEKAIENNRLTEVQKQKKAYYMQMRIDRSAAKDFGASDHSRYFPRSLLSVAEEMRNVTEERGEEAFEEE